MGAGQGKYRLPTLGWLDLRFLHESLDRVNSHTDTLLIKSLTALLSQVHRAMVLCPPPVKEFMETLEELFAVSRGFAIQEN